ncbi:hypothetical protein FF38_06343 [Lucilia cuprina]|uniref:C2H2-type domain-containing protein n=1 Tax=Lucilia cuprina TaxID=7375 RepID=A0A0L0C3F5_LUCCU|nr:hypothetical protein FF38_06343 [Lucilia cuprina]
MSERTTYADIFASSYQLAIHREMHTTERKYCCIICAESFNDSKALYHHQALHAKENKYVCNLCGKSYRQSAGLSQHMRWHRKQQERSLIIDIEKYLRILNMEKRKSVNERLKNVKLQSNVNKTAPGVKAKANEETNLEEYPKLRKPKPATLLKIQARQKKTNDLAIKATVKDLETADEKHVQVPLRQEFLDKKQQLEKATTNLLKKYEIRKMQGRLLDDDMCSLDSEEAQPLTLHQELDLQFNDLKLKDNENQITNVKNNKELNFLEQHLVNILYTKVQAHPNGFFAENLPLWYKKTFDKDIAKDWLELMERSRKFYIEKVQNKTVLYSKEVEFTDIKASGDMAEAPETEKESTHLIEKLFEKMLKNCFLPVNYNKPQTQTCGEIICENLQEFIINCKLCKIKIFEFEEFVQHFKNVHLDKALINDSTTERKIENKLHEDQEENYERVIKLEISEAHEPLKNDEKFTANIDNEEFLWEADNSNYTDDDKDEDYNTEDDGDPEEDEEQSKSIMRKPRKPKEFSCEICNKKYADSRRLQLHVKIVHLREKPYKCSMCDQAFAEERTLKNHVGHKHTGYECPECHKNFSTNRNLKRHMLIHVDKKEFICQEDNCGKAFATKGQLKDHQRYHTSEMFICEECGYKCRQRESLIVHKRHHTGEKPFGCKLCDRRFGSKPLLNEHMATHETERKHICDVCGKSFNRPKALYHHKHLHLGVKKFVCKICGQAYAQAAGLSAHMRKHREEGGSASFTTEPALPPNNTNILNCKRHESLREHKRQHTGEIPFGCEVCGRSFSLKKLLTRHMSSHETVRKHVCNVCGKSFNRHNALYHHKHLHSDVKKFFVKYVVRPMLRQRDYPLICENIEKIIICNFCQIKIFEFNEFVEHFRTIHWPEINGTHNKYNTLLHNVHPVKQAKIEDVKQLKLEVNEQAKDFHIEDESMQGSENDWRPELEMQQNISNSGFSNQEEDNCSDREESIGILKKEYLQNEKPNLKRKKHDFKCSICARTFIKKSTYETHIKEHKIMPYKCTKCSRSFDEELQLMQHQHLHDGYACDICQKVFKKRNNLVSHKETHVKTKNFKCTYENCEKAYSGQRQLQRHMRLVHIRGACFVCDICGSRQRDKIALADHMRSHTGERPFACSLCARRFMTKSRLGEHKACHETERKHVCEVCGKNFNRAKALYHHKHLHLDVKKFVCKLCGAAYAQCAGLSAHMRKHKDQQVFKQLFKLKLGKMLKNCFLPIQYNNLTSKTCGEIICQSETVFSIVCKFCDLRIFEYEEFLQHFRNNHWTEQLNVKNDGGNKECNEKSLDPNEIENEKLVKRDVCLESKILYDVEETEEDLETNDDDEWQPEMEEEQNEDSNDMTETKAILKKPVKDNKKRERPFKCEMCTRTFSNKSNYEAHKLKHKTVQYNCEKCSKTFVTEHELGLHQRSHNGYSCSICNMSFMKYESLRTHKESHIETKNFICTYKDCNKAFATKRRLGSHMRLHIREPTLVCELCGGRYRSTKELNDHIRRHTGEKPFACNLCDRRFTSKSLLGEHMACHETERKHVCEVCGKGFNRPKALYHHKHLHLEVKKFVCKICGAAYAQCAGLSAHMRKHKEKANMPTDFPRNDIILYEWKNNIKSENETDEEFLSNDCDKRYLANELVVKQTSEGGQDIDSEKEEENGNSSESSEDFSKSLVILKKATDKSSKTRKKKLFECTQCKRKFNTNFYLRIHVRQEHEPVSFQCDKCSKSFVEKRYLKLHQRSHIGYTCQICNKVFDKYEALRYHSESHIESRNFICDYEKCGKAFPNNRRLSAHKRCHFAVAPFVCEICGSRQRSKEFLIVHIRTHTGEKPYACSQCDRRFASKHFLQDHQAVHATERTHVCTVCGKAFASSKSLYHHRDLHLGIKKYVCKICNSAYTQSAGLSAHMRKHKQDSGLLDVEQTTSNN